MNTFRIVQALRSGVEEGLQSGPLDEGVGGEPAEASQQVGVAGGVDGAGLAQQAEEGEREGDVAAQVAVAAVEVVVEGRLGTPRGLGHARQGERVGVAAVELP